MEINDNRVSYKLLEYCFFNETHHSQPQGKEVPIMAIILLHVKTPHLTEGAA